MLRSIFQTQYHEFVNDYLFERNNEILSKKVTQSARLWLSITKTDRFWLIYTGSTNPGLQSLDYCLMVFCRSLASVTFGFHKVFIFPWILFTNNSQNYFLNVKRLGKSQTLINRNIQSYEKPYKTHFVLSPNLFNHSSLFYIHNLNDKINLMQEKKRTRSK